MRNDWHVRLVEADGDRALFGIDTDDLADVAVEDVFVIVVFGLDDLVAEAELPAELLDRGFVRAGRVQLGLETEVEFADAQ